MILRDQEIIFVHIPKTGGTSIEDAIFPPREDRDRLEHLWGEPNPYQTGGMQHLTASQIKTEVGNGLYDRCFKFAFVRNPWDKAVSMYSFHRNNLGLQKLLGIADKNRLRWYLRKHRVIPFKEYLRALQSGPSHVQWMEQYKFICDNRGEVLVDFVGRFERLAADFEIITKEFGRSISALPHKNRSQHKHYTDYYDDECRDLVSDLWSQDIEMFKYSFGS